MSLRTAARALAAAALLAGCASSPPAPTAPPRAPKLLPRSSVAAVLGQRGELGLDDAEVRRLEAIEAELERAQAAVAAKAPRPAPGAGVAPGTGARPSDPGGAAGRPRGGHGDPRDALHGGPDPDAAVDRLDTEAYFRAEAALRPELRERARAVAERYREELYEQRAARRAQGRP